jgi:hypothetical protein
MPLDAVNPSRQRIPAVLRGQEGKERVQEGFRVSGFRVQENAKGELHKILYLNRFSSPFLLPC